MFKKLIFILLFLAQVQADTILIDPIFKPPQFTTITRPICSSTFGCFGYNRDTSQFEYFDGIAWKVMGSGSSTAPDPNIIHQMFDSLGPFHIKLSEGPNRIATDTAYTIPQNICPNGEIFKSDGTNIICSPDVNTQIIVEDVLDSVITTNALSANQGRILNDKTIQNATAIATNTIDIATNASNIAVNAINIANNAAAIATNTINIADNTAAISTNTTDIAANADAITALDLRIDPLEADTHTHANKVLLDSLISNGTGDNFLSDDGTYKIPGGGNFVSGPASSVTDTIPRFADDTGKLLKGSGIVISDTDDLSEIQEITIKGKNSNNILAPVSAVNLGIGRTSSFTLNAGQTSADISIERGSSGGGYRHFISSMHSGSTDSNNQLRFYLNTGNSTGLSTAPGVSNSISLTMTPVGVGILKINPTQALDIFGNTTMTGSLTINDDGINSSIFPLTRGTNGQVLKTDGAGILDWSSAASLNNWQAAHAYLLGETVVSNNKDIFRALLDHTSTNDFVADRLVGNWEKISPTYFLTFTPGYQYFAGDLIKTFDEQIWVARVNFVGASDPLVNMNARDMEMRSPSDLSTSPLKGGDVTFSGTTYSITAGYGVQVKNATGQFSYITPVDWLATNISEPLPNPTGYNTIQVNASGAVTAVSGFNGPQASKDNIVLATIFAPTRDIMLRASPAEDHGNSMRTFSLIVGIIKSGIIFTGNPNQTFITSAGSLFLDGIGKGTETPNLKNCPAQAVTSFRLYDQDTDLGVTTIIPNNQYDVAGTLTNFSGTDWGYHKIFLAPNCQIIVQYGQDVAPTKNEITALENENRDKYVVNQELRGIVKYVGIVFFQNGNTDFSSIATTSWTNSGLFGIGIAGSGSSITATGDVLGPISSIANHPALFDGDTGKLIKDDSGATFDSTGGLTLDGGTAGLTITKPSGTASLQTTGLTFTNITNGSSLALLPSPTQAGNVTLTFPQNAPGNKQTLQADSFGQLSWVPGGSYANWVASHDYVVGETVVSPMDSNDIFRALVAHTSTASFTTDRLAGNYWEMISPSHFIPYAPAKQFFAEDLIRTNDGSIYKATGNFLASTAPVDIAAGRMEFMSPADYTTSATSGGVVTFAGTTYSITAGTGMIVTNGGTPFSSIQNVTWPATTIPEPLPNAVGYNTISVSNAGVVSASSGLDSPASAKSSIVLATIFAPNRNIILRNGAATDHGNTNRALSIFLGMIKDKIEFTGNANLTFQTKAGSIYWDGINPGGENPNIKNCPVQTATLFTRFDQDSSTAPTTLVDTLNWDSGGTLYGIPGGQWSYAKIFLSANCSVYMQYGQNTAATEAAIIAAEESGRNSYVTNPALKEGVKFVGLVFFQQGVTSLSESPLVTWINGGQFGIGISGSGSTVTNSGDIFGPASSTDLSIAVFDGGTGKIIKESVPTIDANGSIAGVGNLTVNGLNTNTPAATTAALTLHGGRTTADGLVANQTSGDMAFEFGGSGYKHYISTTHTGTANSTGNAMKFWMNGGAQFGSTAPGTGNNLALTLTPVGVGVLTAAPFQELDVDGDIVTSFHGNASQHNAAEVGNRRIGHISGTNAEFAGMQVNVKAVESDGTARANNSDIAFYTWGQSISASKEQMRLTERGRLGIGTTNPLSLLTVNGDVTVGGVGSTTNVGIGDLKVVGPATNISGPHMVFNDDGDIYPQRNIVNWGHNNIHDCWDCYFDGTNWRNSNTSSSFRWAKDGVYMTLNAVEFPTAGGTEASSPMIYFHENGTVLLRKWQTTGGSASYPYQGGTIDFYTSRGRVAELRGLSSAGGNLDGSSEMYNNCGGWGWRRAWYVNTNSPPSVYFEGNITASSYANNSDRQLKKDIGDISSGVLKKFKDIEIKQFRWKDKPYIYRKPGDKLTDVEKETRWHFGVIAQDLEKLFPDMVTESEKDITIRTNEDDKATPKIIKIKSYDMGDLLGLALAKIQELEKRIEVLEKK